MSLARLTLAATIGVSSVAKKASKMTDAELVRKLFPGPVRKELARVLEDLNADRPTRRKPLKPLKSR